MKWRIGWVPFSALLAAQVAQAQPVGFEEAIAIARTQTPLVEARALQVDARERRAEAADELPDPRLSVGIANLPVTGPVAFEPDRQLPTQFAIGIAQDFPNLAKRHADRSIAEAETGIARAGLAHARHHGAIGAGEAWVLLWYAQQRAALTRDGLAQLQQLVAPARSTVASGSARPAQSLEIRRVLIAMEDVLTAIQAEQNIVRAALVRYVPVADAEAIGPGPGLMVDVDQLRSTLVHNPEIAIADARSARAEAATDRAFADRRPDFGVSVNYGRRDGQFGDAVSVMGSVTLPIFTDRRQQPRIEAAEAEASAARAERDEQLRALEAQFAADVARWRSAVTQWERARDELLPLARQRADLEMASYEAGRATLLDVIAARSALIELELEILEREAVAVLAATRLRLTYVEHRP
jgi:outer membrane protein TolC